MINAVEIVMTEEAVTIVVEVVMKEEKKEGIIQVKIGIVLNAEIAIFHSVKTVTAVKHLVQVLDVQVLAVMKDMVTVTRGEVATTEEVAMTAVMTEEVATAGVILIVLQAEMALITVMTGNVQSVKIVIFLSALNVIAVD